MADIDVVPRKRSNTWLWVALAIIAALIVWVVMSRMGDSPNRVGSADVVNEFPTSTSLATA